MDIQRLALVHYAREVLATQGFTQADLDLLFGTQAQKQLAQAQGGSIVIDRTSHRPLAVSAFAPRRGKLDKRGRRFSGKLTRASGRKPVRMKKISQEMRAQVEDWALNHHHEARKISAELRLKFNRILTLRQIRSIIADARSAVI